MSLEKGNAQQIFEYVFNDAVETGQISNISEVSRKARIPLTVVYLNLKGERKWSADNWLKALEAVGALKYYPEKQRIVIDFSPPKKLMLKDKMASNSL